MNGRWPSTVITSAVGLIPRGLQQPTYGQQDLGKIWTDDEEDLWKQKEGNSRFCRDYRTLNDVKIQNAVIISRMHQTLPDTTEAQKGQKYFSLLDLASRHPWLKASTRGTRRSPEDVPGVIYEGIMMPFGFANHQAPSRD